MSNQEFMDKAAGAFMVLRVSVKRWEGVKRSRKVAEAAAVAGNLSDANALNGSVNLLGAHHADLKLVKAANAKINTYLDEKSLPSDIAGEYMFHVDQVPQVMADLQGLKAAAVAVLDEFLPQYQNFADAARAHLKDYADSSAYPSSEAVRARFEISISAPDFIPAADLSKFKSLPVAQAAEWAAAAETKVARKIEGAREFILDSTRAFMDEAIKAIDKENFRTTDRKAAEVSHLAVQLRQLIADWDNDPRLLALADLIDEKIAPAIRDKSLKGNLSGQHSVRRAARTVVKGIDDHKKNAALLKSQAITSTKKSAPAGAIIGGGMIADLI